MQVRIKTERLCLREIEESDVEEVHAYSSDPEVSRYDPEPMPTFETSQRLIQSIIAVRDTQPRTKYFLAITLLPEERLIGMVTLTVSPFTKGAEIGYSLHRGYWGHGYATEAARSLLEFAFTELGLHRVFADCHPENSASVRVLERLGMRREGHLRENDWFQDRWWDTLIYALLEDEWRAIKVHRPDEGGRISVSHR